jgi:23S rRNA pseudouridine2605 synthase
MKSNTPRHGVARVISKLGLGSRTQAAAWVRDGRVRVNGVLVHDPEFPVRSATDRVTVDGHDDDHGQNNVQPKLFIMLNKPRGLVTTVRDEQGRDTVYRCFEGAGLPWLAPVGRLDKASEGLLLFSNDPEWAAAITRSSVGPSKTYHVQINAVPDASLITALERGTEVDAEHLAAKSARILRAGQKNSWLEIILDEGRNRQIRRLLGAFDIAVLRLVRVAIGPVSLGALPKGAWRALSSEELKALSREP